MRPFDFYKHMELEGVASAYFFKGDADFLKEEAWDRLVEKIAPREARRFNAEKLSAQKHSAESLLNKLAAVPMFGTKRAVFVADVEAWRKQDRKAVISYLQKPYSTACLVLSSPGKKGLEDLEAAVGSVGSVVNFFLPPEREAPRWIRQRARARFEKDISLQAAAMLYNQLGMDMFTIENELEKLALFVGDRHRIEVEDVKETVGFQRTLSVFELLNQVGRGRKTDAVHSLRRLIAAGESAVGIVALLSRQIRLMWQSKDAAQRGLSEAQIGRELGLPAPVVKTYLRSAAFFGEEDFLRFHAALVKSDLALKNTSMPPSLILEDLILTLSDQAKKPLERSRAEQPP